MDIMFEIEKFILEVKKRPALWDPSDKLYLNRTLKLHQWQHVALAIFPEFKTLPQDKRAEIVEDLRKKLKNLKDYRLKQTKLNSTVRAKHLHLLTFLDGKIKQNTIVHKPVSKNDQEKKYALLQNLNEEIEAIDNCADSQTIERQAPPFDEMSSTSSNTISSAEEDSDRSFMLSLLPDIRTMSEQQKFQFKLGMMTLINNIKCQNNIPVNVNQSVRTNESVTNVSQISLSSSNIANEDYEVVYISGIPVSVKK